MYCLHIYNGVLTDRDLAIKGTGTYLFRNDKREKKYFYLVFRPLQTKLISHYQFSYMVPTD